MLRHETGVARVETSQVEPDRGRARRWVRSPGGGAVPPRPPAQLPDRRRVTLMTDPGTLSPSLPSIDAIADAFEAAADRAPTVDRWFRIADATVQVRIVGESLVTPLTRALAHLAIDPTPRADLVVHSWDTAGSGVAPDLPPVDPKIREAAVVEAPDGGPRRWGSPAIVSDSAEGWALWRPGFASLSMVASGGERAWHWVEAAAGIQYWDVSAPFKAIFHRWARERGMQLVHGGAVGTDEGAVLIVGSPGSGKSTTSLVCLDAGMQYLGDDYVMAGLRPEPRVHSVSCAAKLEVPQAKRYSHLMPTIWNADRLDEEKAVGFVDHHPGAAVGSRPLRAIIVPRVSGLANTTVRELSAGAALFALAPSTMIQMPGSREEEFAAMAEMVRHVPTVGVDLGSDLATIAPVIVEVIHG